VPHTYARSSGFDFGHGQAIFGNMNMRKHEANTLIKFCVDTRANSKGDAPQKITNSYLRHQRKAHKGQLEVEVGKREEQDGGPHKENHVSCRTLQALSVSKHVWASASRHLIKNYATNANRVEEVEVRGRHLPIKDEPKKQKPMAVFCIIYQPQEPNNKAS